VRRYFGPPATGAAEKGRREVVNPQADYIFWNAA